MPRGPLITNARTRNLVIAVLMATLLAASLGGAAVLSTARVQAREIHFTPVSVQGLTLSVPDNWNVAAAPKDLSRFDAAVYLQNPDAPIQGLIVAAVSLDEPIGPAQALARAVDLLVLVPEPQLRLGGGLQLTRTGPFLHAATNLIVNDGPHLIDHYVAAVTAADDGGRTYWIITLTGPILGRSDGNRNVITGDPRTAALFRAILHSARLTASDARQ
jgi:hypothetical protein